MIRAYRDDKIGKFPPGSMKRNLSFLDSIRTAWRLWVLLATSSQASASFLVRRLRGSMTVQERAQWLHRWCGVALRRLHIDVTTEGHFPSRGLLVSNHLSYLDILVFIAVSPCVFVSKKEVQSWPLYGAMASMAGTLYIDRSRTSDAQRVSGEMAKALAQGNVVVLFPEGTSSDGSTVLPFRPALFEAAVASGERVWSAHISYVAEGGSVETEICYWGGMTFLPHLWRLMSLRGIHANVKFADESLQFEDRKIAAQTTQRVVSNLATRLRMAN